MSNVKDIVKIVEEISPQIMGDIKGGIHQRVNNTIIVTFLIAWIVSNWSIILYLLHGKGVEEKIKYINKFINVWDGFLIPLSTVIFYIVILPLINEVLIVIKEVCVNNKIVNYLQNWVIIRKVRKIEEQEHEKKKASSEALKFYNRLSEQEFKALDKIKSMEDRASLFDFRGHEVVIHNLREKKLVQEIVSPMESSRYAVTLEGYDMIFHYQSEN